MRVIRRWLIPLVFGVVAMLAAYHITVTQTPRLLMAAAISRLAKPHGSNTFFHAPLANDKSRAIVRPSPDLAYSSCAYDLSKGPVAITVDPVPASYWSLSVFDARTDAVFVRNNVENRNAPIRVVIAREGQGVPPGMVPVRVDADRGVALIRILVDDRARFPAIDAARRLSACGVVPTSAA